jgi:hypothetical protein
MKSRFLLWKFCHPSGHDGVPTTLECRGLLSTETATARPVFERVFRELADPPRPAAGERARERMHRTLKRRAVKPVQRTCAAQQEQFDALRPEYNTERPHDALGGDTPGSRYAPSRRPYAERLPTPEYRGHFLVKRVTDAGTFRFQHRLPYVANAVVNQHIGLEETDDGVWAIYFNTVLLATLDEHDFVIRGQPRTCYPCLQTLVLPVSPAAQARTRTVKGCHTARVRCGAGDGWGGSYVIDGPRKQSSGAATSGPVTYSRTDRSPSLRPR